MKKETNLKKYLPLITLILILTINLNFVNAQNQIIETIMDRTGDAFASIFTPVFTLEGVSDSFLFAKILIFILLFAVIFMSLKQVKIFNRNKPSRIIVAIIVAILAVRYLKETDFTRAILLPYGALGGAITIFLPLIIYFFFVHTSMDSGFGRRVAWVMYGIIFLFLWGSQSTNSSANWIYTSALIFVLVSLIFDKTLHRYFKMGKYDKAKRYINKRAIRDVLTEISESKKLGLDTQDLEDRYQNLLRKI